MIKMENQGLTLNGTVLDLLIELAAFIHVIKSTMERKHGEGFISDQIVKAMELGLDGEYFDVCEFTKRQQEKEKKK